MEDHKRQEQDVVMNENDKEEMKSPALITAKSSVDEINKLIATELKKSLCLTPMKSMA